MMEGRMYYTETNEYLYMQKDGTAVVGLTEHGLSALGEIQHIELPEKGRQVTAGAPVAVVESRKAASDVHTPAGGRITAVNAELEDAPARVNQAPRAEGWIFILADIPEGDLTQLMNETEYTDFIG
ncbi:MAG: glycine cleavage system protein H [Fibrobacterota bacterium]